MSTSYPPQATSMIAPGRSESRFGPVSRRESLSASSAYSVFKFPGDADTAFIAYDELAIVRHEIGDIAKWRRLTDGGLRLGTLVVAVKVDDLIPGAFDGIAEHHQKIVGLGEA